MYVPIGTRLGKQDQDRLLSGSVTNAFKLVTTWRRICSRFHLGGAASTAASPSSAVTVITVSAHLRDRPSSRGVDREKHI